MTATFMNRNMSRGIPQGPLRQIGKTDKIGTKTTFKPDAKIFSATKYSYDTLHKRLQELAFLNKGIRISLRDKRNDQSDEFYYERGIIEFVEHLNRASDTLHADVIFIEGEIDGVGYEVAVQYSGEFTENVQSYVNNIHTHEGGTHVSGFRSALTPFLEQLTARKKTCSRTLRPQG